MKVVIGATVEPWIAKKVKETVEESDKYRTRSHLIESILKDYFERQEEKNE